MALSGTRMPAMISAMEKSPGLVTGWFSTRSPRKGRFVDRACRYYAAKHWSIQRTRSCGSGQPYAVSRQKLVGAFAAKEDSGFVIDSSRSIPIRPVGSSRDTGQGLRQGGY